MHKIEQCTTLEAAKRLGVNRSTVRRLVERGSLVPLAKLPGRTGAFLFDPADIEALAIVDPGPTHDTDDHRPILRRDGA